MRTILICLPLLLLAACSSKLETEQRYADLAEYGYQMGCKSALTASEGPEQVFANAPELAGTKQDYVQGWQQGYQKCEIGLGPVQLPQE